MKKGLALILVVLSLGTVGFLIYKQKTTPVTEKVEDILKIEETDISSLEIMVISLENYVKFDANDKERLSEVMGILNAMEVKASKDREVTGCGTELTIALKDGTVHNIGFIAQDFYIDGTYYTPSQDYSESFRNIVDQFSSRNPITGINSSDISSVEINTGTGLSYTMDKEATKEISELMELLNKVEVKAEKIPLYHRDDCVKIKMQDGTEHSIEFGTEEMSMDEKLFTTENNMKEVIRDFVQKHMDVENSSEI